MKSSHSQQGSILLEAMIGILIFSMGILAVVGLQAASIRSSADAKYRADANFYAGQAIGKWWVNQDNLTAGFTETTSIAGLPNGSRQVTVASTASPNVFEVTVTVSWQPPGTPAAHSHSVSAQVSNGKAG